jgi:hypothetical protein
MSDSTPEDFMDQALALITELKKALEASFAAQNERIDERIDAKIEVLGEQVATQKNRIDTIAGDFTSLNNDFQKHTENSHASKSYFTNAITTHAQSHDLKLQNIKKEFISIEIYDAQIKALNDEIAALKKQIPTTTQSTTLSEEGNDEPGQTATPVQIVLPPSPATPRAPMPDTSHQQTESKTNLFIDDPKLNDLQTDILKAILKSDAYTSINNKNRIRILNEAKKIISENRFVSDDTLHMQVILALHYLSTDKQTCQTFYKNCYMGNPDNLQIVRDTIVPDFIGTHFIFSVNGSTFKSAIDDINFSTLINLAYKKSKTDDGIEKIINAIKDIKVTKGATQ